MDVFFGPGSHNRDKYKLPTLIVQNFFAERAPTQPSREFVLLSTPGLKAHSTMGTTGETGTGIFRQDGLFSGDMFPVVGNRLYRVDKAGTSTIVGSVGPAVGLARYASIRGYLAVLSGSSGTPYLYNGTTLSAFTDADIGSNVKDIASIDQRFLFITQDDQFAWSEPLDPDNVDSLAFATAERSPDDLKAILINHDEVWLMGGDTIEPYQSVGGRDVFVPIPGVSIERGLATRDAATVEDNTVFWVGDDRVVYRADGYSPQAISTPYEEEVLRGIEDVDLPNLVMWSYSQDGHKFVIIRIPNGPSLVYDVTTQQWHTRESRGRANYRPVGCVEWDGRAFIIDGGNNATYEIDPETYTDGGEEIERVAQAYVPLRRNVPCFNFTVDATKGVGDATTEDPQIMLRYSDDQGRKWSSYRFRSLGKVGEYDVKIRWRALGRMQPPGRLFEIKISDPVRVAVYGARLNDTNS